jgi:hypothetical protein
MAVSTPRSRRPPTAAQSATDAVTPSSLSDRIVGFALRAGLAVVAAQTILHLTNALLDYRVWNFHADVDGNAISWLSSVVTFSAALAAAAVASAIPALHRGALALAAVLAFFSLDDVVAFHETIGTHVRGDLLGLSTGWGRVFWPAIFFPLLAFTFLMLLRISWEAPSRASTAIRIALGLFVFAVGAEAAWSAWFLTGGETESWPDTLEVAVEEGAELFGWFLVAGALAATAVAAYEARRLGTGGLPGPSSV